MIRETRLSRRDSGKRPSISEYPLFLIYGKLVRYTQALQLTTDEEKTLRATLYRNRSLARLKTEDYEGAEADATKGGIIEELLLLSF